MKVADWEGILVVNPDRLDEGTARSLQESFESLVGDRSLPLDAELQRPERLEFDIAYLAACGFDDPTSVRLELERELRAGMSERKERAQSVAAAKAGRSVINRTTANVDAFAARLAAALEPMPDPRAFVVAGQETRTVLGASPFDGELTVGEDLFSHGEVFAAGHRVASAGDAYSALFVRCCLASRPDLAAVEVPKGEALVAIVSDWEEARHDWQRGFNEVAEGHLSAIADNRVRAEVRARALSLLHAR